MMEHNSVSLKSHRTSLLRNCGFIPTLLLHEILDLNKELTLESRL